jgi:serine/threonine protein kinase
VLTERPPNELALDRGEHPNVIRAIEVGSISGCAYIAYEAELGKSIERIVTRIRALRRPTPPPIVVRLWSDMLTALDHLHQRRPHGAVTPTNVIVTYSGSAKLADSGLPREGDPSVAADLFGAASAILRLLGRKLPDRLDALLSTMLAKDHSRRPPTARAALERLLQAAGSEDAPASRSAVAQWIAELFSGEKAEELAEMEAILIQISRTPEQGELRWFGQEDGEESTASAEFTTRELQTPFTDGSLLEQVSDTERAEAPALPRSAKRRTVVLDEDDSGSDTMPPPVIEETMFGPYRLAGRIGDGGMAEVLVAERIVDGAEQRCVIKRVAPALRKDPEIAEMFREEARVVRLLSHPNIVECLDAGTIDGVAYIAFELIEGMDLGRLLGAYTVDRIPIGAALQIAISVARALDHAHRVASENGRPLQVVHRDVSPENVLIAWNGEVKLIDFGISKFRDRAHATRAGVLKGKLGYMAPEQLAAGVVDERTDIYQFGVVLVEMLAGQRLFAAESLARPRDLMQTRVLLERHLAAAAPPARLVDLVVRLCAPDPSERPPSVNGVLTELEALHAELGDDSLPEIARARAPSAVLPPQPTIRREPRSLIPLVLAAMLLVTGGVATAVYWFVTK